MIRYAIISGSDTRGDAARLAAAGIDYIQLRNKLLPAGELATLARSILAEIAAVPNAPTRLLINGRPDIAKTVTLSSGTSVGVHLTSAPNELTPPQVREIFASPFRSRSTPYSLLTVPCISVSCHTLEEVARAHTRSADLILFGPVFEKRVARQLITDGSGLDMLRRAVLAAAGTPVLALGGITHENTAPCLEAGSAGIAAIRLFM
jgi:thiamine-phosphate pyrophosphorylase